MFQVHMEPPQAGEEMSARIDQLTSKGLGMRKKFAPQRSRGKLEGATETDEVIDPEAGWIRTHPIDQDEIGPGFEQWITLRRKHHISEPEIIMIDRVPGGPTPGLQPDHGMPDGVLDAA